MTRTLPWLTSSHDLPIAMSRDEIISRPSSPPISAVGASLQFRAMPYVGAMPYVYRFVKESMDFEEANDSFDSEVLMTSFTTELSDFFETMQSLSQNLLLVATPELPVCPARPVFKSMLFMNLRA
jgi:hypothetical protein